MATPSQSHLQKYARDLTVLVAKSDSIQPSAQQEAGRTLAKALIQKDDKRCVILATDEDQAARMIVLSAAQHLLKRNVDVELRRNHIMEIVVDRMLRDCHDQFHAPEELGYLFTVLFAEAHSAANVILWIPSFKGLLQETPVMVAVAEAVRNGSNQIIFALPENDYDHSLLSG